MLYALEYADSGTIIGSWEVAKAVGSAVCNALKLKAGVAVGLDIWNCIIVLVLGPYQGMVVGAHQIEVWSGSQV